jgi:hypothetical protein
MLAEPIHATCDRQVKLLAPAGGDTWRNWCRDPSSTWRDTPMAGTASRVQIRRTFSDGDSTEYRVGGRVVMGILLTDVHGLTGSE